MALQPPYAWPSPSPEMERQASVLAEILRESFAQSGTVIRDPEAILSAARHISQSSRLKLGLSS